MPIHHVPSRAWSVTCSITQPRFVTVEGVNHVKRCSLSCPRRGWKGRPIASQYIKLRALEHTGADVSQDIAPKGEMTGTVLEHMVDGLDAILLAIRAEATTRQLHHAGAVRAEPEVAPEVLVDSRDVEIAQPIAFRVRTEATVFIAHVKEFCEPSCGGHPEPAVGRLEQLKYPRRRQTVLVSVPIAEPGVNDRGLAVRPGAQPKEAPRRVAAQRRPLRS